MKTPSPSSHLWEVYYRHESLIKETRGSRLLRELIDHGNGDFLASWASPRGKTDLPKKKKQIQEMIQIDRQLRDVYKDMGGLSGYLTLSKKLLQKKTTIPHSRFSPPPTTDLRFPFTSDTGKHQKIRSIIQAEEIALNHLDKIGLVLVAGGLGERLQSRTAKVSLKIHYLHHPLIPDDTFLGFYLKTVLALQKLYTEKTGKTTEIPLFIMCSEHNYSAVQEEVHAFLSLGIRSRQITIKKQIETPCLKNPEGEIAIKERYQFIKKPLGHGFVHTLIHRKNYLHTIRDKEYLFFLQDTNPQSVNTLLSGYGITRRLGYAMSWVGVERHPGEQAGLIVGKETSEKGNLKQRVVNIEYNLLANMGSHLPSGQFFANTNNFWLRIQEYREALHTSHGVLPFMVNPKPLTPTSSDYKPFRPETLMQDIAGILPSLQRSSAGIIVYPRHHAFSPVKKPLPKNPTPQNIEYTSLELELNDNRTNLEKLHPYNTIHSDPAGKSLGVLSPLFQSPRVILPPIYKLSREKDTLIRNCTLHPQSLLVVKGTEVTLRNVVLERNAALLIFLADLSNQKIHLTVENLTLRHRGFTYQPLRGNASRTEEHSRGYRINWIKPVVIRIDRPGDYHYGTNGLERR